MTSAEFKAYRFDSINEPTDEQLDYLMEQAAKSATEAGKVADEKFFDLLRQKSNEAKARNKSR